MFKKVLPVALGMFLLSAGMVFAYALHITYVEKGTVQIADPQSIQYFFDTLKGSPRDYAIDEKSPFTFSLTLLVPESTNPTGTVSAEIYSLPDRKDIVFLDGPSATWKETYDAMLREYFLQEPAYQKDLPAGQYGVEITSDKNQGSYVLKVGSQETYPWQGLLQAAWQIPLLQYQFFQTNPAQFFLTPVGIGLIAVLALLLTFILVLNFWIAEIKEHHKEKTAITIMLTSNGMDMKDDIVKLLQKPAYDTNVAFITTASKGVEDTEYVKRDLFAMRETGMNVQEVDIDGKTPGQLYQLFEIKDLVFVEGGNTFYLLNSMRKCGFEKVIRKLLKRGIVYIGASAGSIVTGKNIETAGWLGGDYPTNTMRLGNLRGLNLVPFNIFVHFEEKYKEVISQKIKNPKKRQKQLKILSDGQALLIQNRKVFLLGGEEIIV